MYRIDSENVSILPGVLLAVIAAAVGLVWAWGGAAWLMAAVVVVPFLLLIRYATNQYMMVDPGAGTVSSPSMYFFRCTQADGSLTCDVLAEDEGKGMEYKMVIQGDFGEKTVKLGSYEDYVTEIFKKNAKALNLA